MASLVVLHSHNLNTVRNFGNFPKMSNIIPTVSWLLMVIALSTAQHIDHPDGRSDHFHTQDDNGNFNFGYNTLRNDGSRDSRQERGDAYGNVVGSYSLVDVDGRSRTVDYTAGEEGFKAVVRTNEPGTANQSPAFVSINADPPRGTQGVGRPSTGAFNPPSSVTTGRRPYVRRPVYRQRPTHYQHSDPYTHVNDYGHHSHSHYAYQYPPYY